MYRGMLNLSQLNPTPQNKTYTYVDHFLLLNQNTAEQLPHPTTMPLLLLVVLIDWLIEQRLTSPPTQYRLYH